MSDDDGGGDSMMCCPLDGGDGDGPSCFTQNTPKARKAHVCDECREPIPAGDRYEKVTGIWDGSPSTYKTCLPCVDVREHFSCGRGWIYGQLWSDLRDNFFPDMRCGGQCMEGLSPRGKRKLIDERMEWYFDQDEINDSVWEDWAKRRPNGVTSTG